MSNLLADIKLALRLWQRTPGLTLIAIVSIALGMGATTAVFTLVDQVLLRALPVEDPQALVQVTSRGSRYGSNWGDGSEQSYPMYADLRDHNQVFTGMFGRFGFGFQIGHAGRTERVAGELVTGTYFNVLGVGPAVGRVLTPDDDRVPDGHPVAVLSHAFWTSRFAADPGIVGQSIVVNGHPYIHRRRGASGVRRRRARDTDEGVRADDDEGPGHAGVERARRSTLSLGPAVRPAEAGRERGAGPGILAADLPRPARARGEGARVRDGVAADTKTVRRERDRGRSQSGRTVRVPPQPDTPAPRAPRDCRGRAPHRVRQRRQPVAGAGGGAAARDGDPAGAGLVAPAADGPAAGRERDARRRRHAGRSRAGGDSRARPVELLRRRGSAAAGFDLARPARPGLHLRRHHF